MILVTILSILLGIIACFIGTLVGFGGGFVAVTVLRLFDQLSPATVAGTSLFMVGVNVAVASVALRKKKRINTRMGWPLGCGGIVGTFTGIFTLRFVPGSLFDVLYGLMLIFIAYNMLRSGEANDLPLGQTDSARSLQTKWLELGLIGVAIGFVSTLFGIGAGTISIPLMIWRYKLPAYVAIPTAAFIASIYIWPGIVGQIVAGRVDWALAIPLSIGAVIGSQVGAHYTSIMKSLHLKRIFGAVCVIAFGLLILRHVPAFHHHVTGVAAVSLNQNFVR